MNRAAIDGKRGFFERFSESGVRMRATGDIFAARAEGHRAGRLRNQISGARADDVHAKQAIRFRVRKHFNLAIDLPE
jgi:hypothetical protein